MLTRCEWTIPGGMADMLDFLFVPVCLLCHEPLEKVDREFGGGPPLEQRDEETSLVCRTCECQVREIPVPTCHRCGSPIFREGSSGCLMCRRLPSGFGLMRSAALMEGVGGKLVHLFKYRGWQALANFLAMKIVSSPWSDSGFWNVDLLVPVPISGVRRRERGYNQSELLAESLSQLLCVPTDGGIVERVSWKRPQVGLPYKKRLSNVLRAFSARATADRVAGLRIMIVDDVITTGATVHACYRALREVGAGPVSAVSFGRADDVVDF